MVKDSLLTRVAKHVNGNNTVPMVFQIENGLPIFVCDSTTILKQYGTGVNKPVDTKNEIKIESLNPEEKDRFKFLGSFTSTVTANILSMYYDTKYKDIIISPYLGYLKQAKHNTFIGIRSYALGYGNEEIFESINGGSLITEPNKYELAVPNILTTGKSHEVSISGFRGGYSKEEDDSISITVDKLFYTSRTTSWRNIIELGKVSEIFGNKNTSIPLYLLYQGNYIEYSFKFMGNTTPNDDASVFVYIRY